MKSIFGLLFVLIFSFSAAGQNQSGDSGLKRETDAARLEILIGKIGRSVRANLDSMFAVAFTEVVRQQELKADGSPKGRAKDYVYESVVLNGAPASDAVKNRSVFTRTLKSIDGKPVGNQLFAEDSKCEEMNPQTDYDNPLGFLLPENRVNYTFSSGGEEDVENVKTVVILVAEKPPAEPLAIVEKDDCLFLSRPLRMEGKIWVDGKTSDIVRIQWRQAETFSATVPKKVIKSGVISLVRPKTTISYEKQDFTIGFRLVKLQNSERALLLPYYSENLWINDGMKLAGMRSRVDYTRYRLFNSTVEVKDSGREP